MRKKKNPINRNSLLFTKVSLNLLPPLAFKRIKYMYNIKGQGVSVFTCLTNQNVGKLILGRSSIL